MAPPIGIRYYNLRNSGIAIIIYPQLRNSANTDDIIWDGRNHSGYNIGINQDLTVDLKDTKINSTAKFYLSENTVFGTDMWDSSQEFYYDPNSNLIASATRWGGARDGSLSYQGLKSKGLDADMIASSETEMTIAEQFESYAVLVAHETLRQFFDDAFAAELAIGFPWKGLVKWGSQLPPGQLVLAIGLITAALIARGYAFTFTTATNPDGSHTTTILFGPHQAPEAIEAVPPKIKADWDASVAAAGRYNPQNLGAFPNTRSANGGDESNISDVNSGATSAAIQVA